MLILPRPPSSQVPSAGNFRSGSERAQALRQQKVITLHRRRAVIHLLHQWVWSLLCCLLSSSRTLARGVMAVGRFISSLGWAGAWVSAHNLAGLFGTAATGRARRSSRSALAHPTFSQPAGSDLFSLDNVSVGVRRWQRRRPGRPWRGNTGEITRRLAEEGGWGRLKYRVIFLRKGEHAQHTYRAVVRFDPNDGIVQSVAARYLLRCLDPDLQDCSWARRIRCDGISRPTHNDAVARLRDFRLRYRGRVLSVARLDVRALFDSISHEEVRGALKAAITRAAMRGTEIDVRVLGMVEALLASYAFGPDVWVGARNLLRARDSKGRLAWPLRDLKQFHPDPVAARVGIPQGSAFSDLLANLVLDAVDRAVVGDGTDRTLLYARFLDDILIVHTDRGACEAALARAMEALRQLKLVPHQPRAFGVSDTEYWRAKSLAPIPWAPVGEGREWIGFLGYELRHDGEVRIRRETIERHKERLRDIAMGDQDAFDSQLYGQGARARRWLASHAARSVTKLEEKLVRACVRRGLCWTGAFPLAVYGGKTLEKQAKDLDRYRRILLSRYRKYVEEHGRRLGLALGKVRGLRDHYRCSYYWNLVGRYAASAAAAAVPRVPTNPEPMNTEGDAGRVGARQADATVVVPRLASSGGKEWRQ